MIRHLLLFFCFALPILSGRETTMTRGIVFCWCPPDKGEEGFWMAKHETTVGLVKGKAGLTLADGTVLQPDHPMVMVDLKTIGRFLRALNEEGQSDGSLPEGWEYDLPTQIEWTRACRAGETKEPSPAQLAREGNFADDALRESAVDGDFYYAESGVTDGFAFLAPVGSLQANSLGLHDLRGNVWEMVWRETKKEKQVIFCGGSWCSPAGLCRADSRRQGYDREKSRFSGFRIVMRKK